MTNFDFATAKVNHVNWKLRLRAFLRGEDRISEAELVSHHECALGKWLDTSGLPIYADTAEMAELYAVHEKLHVIARAIVEAKNAGRVDEAKKRYLELEPITERILELLGLLEQKAPAA